MDEFAMGSSNEQRQRSSQKPLESRSSARRILRRQCAAVAAGMVAAATATDTGGSIRQPAAFTGTTGIKPTYGRCSRYGMIAYASSLDQAGPIAQTAQDCALMLSAMASHDSKDSTSAIEGSEDFSRLLDHDIKGLKIGLPRAFFTNELDPKVATATQQALAELEERGAVLVDIDLPNIDLSLPAYYVIAPAEASANLSRFDGVRFGYRCENPKDLNDLYERSRSEGFGAEVQRRILVGTYALSASFFDAYYVQAQKIRRLIKNDFVQALSEVDMIASPTTPTPAFKIGEKSDKPSDMYLQDVFTISANLAGIPGLSMPCGQVDSLPVGLQLLGNYFDEARLLGVAHQFQQITDWHAPRGGLSMMWETVIGLEIHTQLSTDSKIFSGSSTAFGQAPNTQANAVDLGLPGILPVPNAKAFEYAAMFGMAIGAQVNTRSTFDRKNYFTQIFRKGYQTTQLFHPIVEHGAVDIQVDDETQDYWRYARAP